MSHIPESAQQLIDDLSELPSIGPRQATRLVFYLVSLGPEVIEGLSRDFSKLKNIELCEQCFFIYDPSDNKDSKKEKLCDICRDSKRDKLTVAVVEKETDLLSLEKTKKFEGIYLVLGNIPKTGGLQPRHELRLEKLKSFIEKESTNGKAEEIILAFDQTSVGDYHTEMIKKELEDYAKKITRLGRGIPTGGEVEFADEETLSGALERRG